MTDLLVLVGDQLPNTGVKLSMWIFGGLTLLILGGAALLAGRRR